MIQQEEGVRFLASLALIKHQVTRWGQSWGQTVDPKVTELNVLLAGSVFALLRVWDWASHGSAKNHTVHMWISCLYSSGRISSYTHKHGHAAVRNAFPPATRPAGARRRRRVAGGVPGGCDSCISVFVLCQRPLPLRRWQSRTARGGETWDRQSLVVNNNSFMRRGGCLLHSKIWGRKGGTQRQPPHPGV